jgi:hypothetical protein
MDAVKDFVRTYTHEAESKIAFAWNGKHANEFIDSNMNFRQVVCNYFEDEKDGFSLSLIAALYKLRPFLRKKLGE